MGSRWLLCVTAITIGEYPNVVPELVRLVEGALDLGTGYPEYECVVHNFMDWDHGGKKFADVSTAGGFAHLQKGHGIAFAEFDAVDTAIEVAEGEAEWKPIAIVPGGAK